ncbi:hypothetical protein DYL61_16790 [Pseudomonas nabeulensis]|uniref:Uncharacterized protein n=2 Tax=Pseudomonas TaxID=286 RepID=A0A7X2C2E3_9PSED|nr:MULTISPECIES: hypothetical protein [Pseudomonas]MQT88087.1 hypothetical protein [Pseudomonas helleri]TFY92884.1 hypothetical protein DYL61_16790 [Pseudomonas nabeulensis]
MTVAQSTSRSTATLVMQVLLWSWLIGLSVMVGLGYRLMTDLVDQERVDTGLRQLQVLQTRVTELADSLQALEARPVPATEAALQSARQTLEMRIGQIEQALEARATTDDLQALRSELDQFKASQTAARTALPPNNRAPKPAASKPHETPFPYRVVGVELRAGHRSVSIAPAVGELTATEVQVVLPGDVVGQWRLQAIDGKTAVFKAGDQTRRLAIP